MDTRFFLLSLSVLEKSCKWCHWALPREGSSMGTYQGHSKPYSALSPLHARPQLQLSVGSRQQEVPTTGLWLHLSISPRTLSSSQGLSTCSKEERSQAFVWGSGSRLPHSFWGNSWKAALKNSFASCIPSRSFISWLISSRFYRRMGELDWIKAFAYTRHEIVRTKSFFTKSPVKAFYRCKNMQVTFSFSPSHLPGPRVTRKLHIVSAYIVKWE